MSDNSKIKDNVPVMLRIPREMYEVVKKLGITNNLKIAPQCMELIQSALAVQATEDMRSPIELILRQAVLDANDPMIARLSGTLSKTQRTAYRNEAMLLWIIHSITGSKEKTKEILEEADERAIVRLAKNIGNEVDDAKIIE